jgi:spore coat protein U-like protein
MLRLSTRSAAATAAAAVALIAAAPAAAQTSASLAVTAAVSSNCTIATTPVAFGSYDPLSAANVTATGTVRVRCTRGAIPTVALDVGSHASGSIRRMADGASTPSFLAYELKKPTANSVGAGCPAFGAGSVWSTGAGAMAFTAAPSSAVRIYNVCGELAGGQDVPAGSYTDSVLATVTF